MNKNIIQIGSLCIFILLLISVLYVTKTNEGFRAVVLTKDPELLTSAKLAVSRATTALSTATNAVGTNTETSAAKEAYSKATEAVTASNAAIADTMNSLKIALGLQNVEGDPSMADINEKIATLNQFAETAKTTLNNAETDKRNKNPAAKKEAMEAADRDAATKKAAWEALPN